MNQVYLLALVALVLGVFAQAQNSCNPFGTEDPIPEIFFTHNFGIRDSNDAISTAYSYELYKSWWGDFDTNAAQFNGFYGNFFTYMVNSVPLMGGKNITNYDTSGVRTASLVCDTEYSATWGPLYPSYFEDDQDLFTNDFIRGRHNDLETYLHYSAPNQTSYMRNIITIKNVGSAVKPVSLAADWQMDTYGIDISPISNEGRYYTMWPWQEGDLGSRGDNPSATFDNHFPATLHARGPKSRVINLVIDSSLAGDYVIGPAYYTKLAPGQTMSLMFIVSTGMNTTNALKNAAEIDTEPAHIFHDLNADQLSLIRNWGGCQVVLAPAVTVAVNAPSQCSQSASSDFEVTVETTRTDFTDDFTHRVVRLTGTQVVPAQTSTTLTVLNGLGQLKHQLWYKECLVKETVFTACAAAGPVAPTTQSEPSSGPTGKVSSSSSLGLNLLVVSVVALFGSLMSGTRSCSTAIVVACVLCLVMNNGVQAQVSYCVNATVGNPGQGQLEWYFGYENGGAMHYTFINTDWWSTHDYYVDAANSLFDSNFFNFFINAVPLTGALNFTRTLDVETPTASFTCDTSYSALWGPAYPDYREGDLGERGQYQNLEVYVHFSAPAETSYVRAVLFIKNTGSTAERVRISGDWYMKYFGNDIGPLDSDGRYFVPFPYQDDDMGRSGSNPGAIWSDYFNSIHVAGPNARDQSTVLVREFNSKFVSPAYYTTLAAGKQMAMMYIVNSALNRTAILDRAAAIDAEPAYIFHNLNADQISLIRNWGACQSVLAPAVTVSISVPSQCSSGATSDYTVTATTARSDFTSGFTHRVYSALEPKEDIVAPQSSTTLSIPNGATALVHQLWYKECLIKETEFEACE